MVTSEDIARIIHSFCRLKGWCVPWEHLSQKEREEFIGVAEAAATQYAKEWTRYAKELVDAEVKRALG